MKNIFKRSGAALISLVLLLVLAISAGAASSQNVGVKFWKERSDKESMANSGIDPDRTATLTRQANGTYTLTLPVMQVSKLGVTGYLSGLTIGDVTYDGTLTGDFNKATAVLTIKNLPASVLTGSDVNKSFEDGFCDNGDKNSIDKSKESFSSTYFKSIASNKYFDAIADLKLSQPNSLQANPNYGPLSDSPLRGAASFTDPLVANGFDEVTYIGAFADENDGWMSGWTEFDPQNKAY